MGYTKKRTQKMPNVPKMVTSMEIISLRKCLKCGLEALIEDDLELFVKNNKLKYKRENLCKICWNTQRRNRYKIDEKYRYKCMDQARKRQKDLINSFNKPIICYFCKKEITNLKGIEPNSIHIHSLDGNHKNWCLENKVPAHMSCHLRDANKDKFGDKNPMYGKIRTFETRYKASLSMREEKNPMWLGNGAKPGSIRLRKCRLNRINKKFVGTLNK